MMAILPSARRSATVQTAKPPIWSTSAMVWLACFFQVRPRRMPSSAHWRRSSMVTGTWEGSAKGVPSLRQKKFCRRSAVSARPHASSISRGVTVGERIWLRW
jgi:hypothetical protein